jgi:hypothetical protein
MDSATVLSQHTPVRPTERRTSSSCEARANSAEVYWAVRYAD